MVDRDTATFVDRLVHRVTEAGDRGALGKEVTIASAVAAAEARTGKVLPINVTGAIGAIATAMDLPQNVVRGLGVMARAIGLVGHLVEEGRQPIAGRIWREAEDRATRRD